jgi:hypothetical protein
MANERDVLKLRLEPVSVADGLATAVDWDLHLRRFVKEPIKRAAYLAMQDTAKDIVKYGRNEIGIGGFGVKWQNAFIANVYPKDKPSLNAAIQVRHKIPYAGVFEAGGRVEGNPIMWIPTKNAPVPGGRLRKMTPKRFVQQFGPLRGPRRTRKRKVPVLYGRIGTSKRYVAMFFGIYLAQQKSKFSIARVIRFAVDRFGDYYGKRLDEEQSR